MRALLAALVLLAATVAAQGSEIVGALSQNRVSLTANFSGSQILVFGAIRNSAPDFASGDDLENFDIAIAIEGPREPVAIWRRERVLGIWMNVENVVLPAAPSFYAVATTAPLAQILAPEADAEHRISAPQAIRPDHALGEVDEITPFAEALLRIRARESQYLTLERWVHVDGGVLFRANVALPANLTEGAYTTRMYLLRDGQVVHQFRTAIFVRKDGLEEAMHRLSREQPFLYGLLALVIALVAGWGAQAVFSAIRQR